MTPPTWLGHSWLTPAHLDALLQGLLLTAQLALLASLFATLLGILLTLATDSRKQPFALLAHGFIRLHRNTPLMVQILLWYFAVPGLLGENAMIWLNTPHTLAPGLSWPSYECLAAFIAIGHYGACFIAGELTAGLRAVARGQYEAASALGLSAWQRYRFVILPQVMQHVRRPLIGQYTGIIKNTSLAMAVGVAELSGRSRQVESESLLTFQAFAVATALYLVLILACQLAGHTRQTEIRP